MAENTRLKELQHDVKGLQDFVADATDRFGHVQLRLDRLDGRFDGLEQKMSAVLKVMETLSRSSTSHDTPPQQPSSFSQYRPRTVKMSFPHFDGTDALNWLFKADQYFKYYEVPDAQRLVLASVHFDGDVLPWFQMLEKAGRLPDWNALSRAVEAQYGPSPFDSARSQLFKLTHELLGGNLEEYNLKFLTLANRTEDMSEDALLDCYVGGLKPALRRDVLVQRPTTVLSAMTLAKLFDGTSPGSGSPRSQDLPHYVKHKTPAIVPVNTATSSTTSGGGKSNLPPLLPTPKTPQIKKMTSAEMQVRREKGLCYWCDSKFSPSHRCANKQLMMLIGDEDEDSEPPADGIDHSDVADIDHSDVAASLHHLSLHALRGTHGPATIRFEGSMFGTTIQVLLDGGSSDNFLHPRIADHLQLPRETTPDLRVMGGT